jgi:hypothetical protein
MKSNDADFQFFQKLPPSLYYELRNFLLPRSYYQLMISSKVLNPVRHETRIVMLKDPKDLSVILSKIQNPRSQLVVTADSKFGSFKKLLETPAYKLILKHNLISESDRNLLDWQKIGKYHTVVRTEGIEAEFPENLSTDLKEIAISFPPGKLRDVSAFSHLTKLSLDNCERVTNVNCLRNLSFLVVSYCSNIRDVSQLGGVFDLTLRQCSGIVDISQLVSNTNLSILLCANINSQTMNFRNVRSLKTDLFRRYEDTIALTNSRSIKLFKYTGSAVCTQHRSLKDITIFGDRKIGTQSLNLSNFSHLFRVVLANLPYVPLELSPLHSVPVVRLLSLIIDSIEGLGGNWMVSVSHCPLIANFSPLRKVHRVVISSNPKIENGKELEEVSDLTVDSCSSFTYTTGLEKLKHLHLEDCNSLKEVRGLENISTVTILSCRNLSSMNGLGNNDKIITDKSKLDVLFKNHNITLNDYEMSQWNFDPSKVVLLRKRWK